MQSRLLAEFTDIYDSVRQSALSRVDLVLSRSEVPALYRTVARIAPDFRPVTYGISRRTGDAMTHRYVKCMTAAEY